jgi:hypothetical protein
MIRSRPGALLLMAALGIAEARAAGSDCEQHQLADVRLHVTEGGAVLLPVTVDGREVYFHLRVGSGLSLVAQRAVDVLGLKAMARIGGSEMIWNGQKVTHYVKLEEMVIGNFRLAARNSPVMPTDEALDEVDGKPVVGILGSTLFRAVDAELNVGGNQLKLFRQFRCLKRSPVYFWESPAAEMPMRFDAAGTLVLTLELEGQKIDASVLTGGRDSRIDANAARQYFGVDSNEVYHPMSLTSPTLQIKDAQVVLAPGSRCKLTSSTAVYGSIGYASCVNIVPFSLGTDMLSQLRMYISSARQKVYITRTDKAGNDSGTLNIVPVR